MSFFTSNCRTEAVARAGQALSGVACLPSGHEWLLDSFHVTPYQGPTVGPHPLSVTLLLSSSSEQTGWGSTQVVAMIPPIRINTRSVQQATSGEREATGTLGQGLELEGGRMSPPHSCLSGPFPPRNGPAVPDRCSKPRTVLDGILESPGEARAALRQKAPI